MVCAHDIDSEQGFVETRSSVSPAEQLSHPVVRNIYRTCVLPAIEYSSLAWSGMGKRNAQLLDRVHRRAARLISGTRLSELVSNELLLSRTGL